MAPPNKRQRHLKHLQELKRLDREAVAVTSELTDSPEEISVVDDFFFEGLMERDTNLIEKRLEDLIKWKPEAGSQLRNYYSKDSRTTIYRRNLEKKKNSEIMAGSKTIDMYFSKSQFTNPTEAQDHSGSSKMDQIAKAIAKLESLHLESNSIRANNCLKSCSQFDRLRLLAVLRFLRMTIIDPKSRVTSSEQISGVLFGKEGPSYRARTVRDWSDSFVKHSELPRLSQGKFQKTKSLIDDEDVQSVCVSYIRSLKAGQIDSRSFMKWINENLETECALEYNVTVSERTARNWLFKLNLHYEEYRQGSTYVDGHERPDVVRYRNNFVVEFESWQRRMETYTGDDMEVVISPDLNDGEARVVLVTQDECIFQAHDGKKKIWQEQDRKKIRPKGEGASIMVSAFLCPCHGMLRLSLEMASDHPDISPDSTHIMFPGANRDGYFTCEDLAQQTNNMLRIFEILHPGCIALVAYDNSANHHAMAADALLANRLNLKDGGKNTACTRPGWFIGPDGTKVLQRMQTAEGKQKGCHTILQERNLFVNGMQLKECREVLSRQPDFQEQKPMLEEAVRSMGHEIIFYPKFHPEFNFIEMFWGACKAYARKRCDYSWAGLKSVVPEALESVSLPTIRRFARKSDRYIDAYREKDGGLRLTPAQVEHAVNKYKSHRTIPLSIMKDL